MKPDPALLDLMVADHATIDPKWQVAPYWRTIAGPLTEEFRNPGSVRSFRRLAMRTGIRSEMPSNPSRVPFSTGFKGAMFRALQHLPGIGSIARVQNDLVRKHVETFQHKLVLAYLCLRERYGGDVLDDAGVGQPDSVVEIDGRVYEDRSLGYQNLHQWVTKRLDFTRVQSVLDLGSGYGGQIEILLRRHPHVRCVAMDIPPWLYIAEIYLEALFPGEVLSYRATRELPDGASVLDHMKGKRIAIVPAWKWQHLADAYDLFWNSKSIQEMNDHGPFYLDLAARHCRMLFLHAWQSPKGKILSPAALRDMVLQGGPFRQLAYEQDLFAWRGSMSMLFEREAGS